MTRTYAIHNIKNKFTFYPSRIIVILALFTIIQWIIPQPARCEVKTSAILPGDGFTDKHFGQSVAIFDGSAIIGAYGDDERNAESGAAYVFTQTASRWQQYVKLKPADSAAHDFFGYAMNTDGRLAIIGAFNHQEGKGAAYIYDSADGNWNQQAKLMADDGRSDDNFGYDVAISDGWAIVGAFRSDAAGSDAGAAYVYRQSDLGWTKSARITAPDGEAGDYFGRAVDICLPYAAVSAIHHQKTGAVYIYEKVGDSWRFQCKIQPNDGSAGDFFGFSLALAKNILVVGSDGNGGTGAAYVYRKTASAWTRDAKLVLLLAPTARAVRTIPAQCFSFSGFKGIGPPSRNWRPPTPPHTIASVSVQRYAALGRDSTP